MELLVIGDHVDLDATLLCCFHSFRGNCRHEPILLLVGLLSEAMLVNHLLIYLVRCLALRHVLNFEFIFNKIVRSFIILLDLNLTERRASINFEIITSPVLAMCTI